MKIKLPKLDSEYLIPEEKINFFWENGFVVLKNVLSKEDYKLIESSKIKINSSRLPLRCPNDFSVDAKDINWSKYDIVISLNFAVPIKIRRKHPEILWICMTGEGRFPVQSLCWDYFISRYWIKRI